MAEESIDLEINDIACIWNKKPGLYMELPKGLYEISIKASQIENKQELANALLKELSKEIKNDQ